MSWTRMKTSFRDLTTRYPDPVFKNLYASYACFARDGVAFREALAALGPGELDPKTWLAAYPHSACMQWAGI
jgi:hypothetical protein